MDSPLVQSSRAAGTALREGDREKLQEAISSISRNGGGSPQKASAAELGTLKARETPAMQQANDNQGANNGRGRQLDGQRSLGYGR